MAKIVGIGETVLDIIFDQDNQPLCARPGGSVFNAMVSVARSGHEAQMISETGADHVGDIICKFLRDNGISDACVKRNAGAQSHLALAFLDSEKKANYQFYKDYSSQQIDFITPSFATGDALLFGSFFAINKRLRPNVSHVLQTARQAGAMLFYDVNFRPTHSNEAASLWPLIEQNMRLAHIVKGSDEDIQNMLGTTDWRQAYADVIRPLCPFFICTQGKHGATLLSPDGEFSVDARHLTPVSTVGAGDSFNAGTLCGLIDAGATAEAASQPGFAKTIATAMQNGIDFASEVCQSLDNYIAPRR